MPRVPAPQLLLLLGPACQSAAPATAGEVASFDGAAIAYERQGAGDPALVFVHGWACNRGHWERQAPVFARDRTVVTLDLGGHGDSAKAREAWSIPALGRDVAAVVEHLDLERVVLVGHSMGGQVCLEAAHLLPGRVLGVVGADTLHGPDPPMSPEVFEQVLAAYEADFAGTMRSAVPMMFLGEPDPALVERVAADMASADPGVALGLFRAFPSYDLRAALAATTVPVRCINAAYMPTQVDANRATGADFDAVIMDGAGHFLMLERPEEFNAHLAFFVAELSAR